MISEQRWNRFMNSLRKAGRNHLAESFQSGCNDGDLIMVEREIERPVDGSLRELLRLTKGAQFDRAGAWDVYHLIPPEAPLDLASAMEAIRDSNRCFNRGDYPLLAALDGVVVVQAPDESIVRCEPGGGREDMFDNLGALLETMTQLHEKGIFVLKPDETIDYDFEAYCKLSADLNPSSSYWRS
jgi:hypothetical protein